MIIQLEDFITDYECEFLSNKIDSLVVNEKFGPDPFYHWINLDYDDPLFSTPFFQKLIAKHFQFLNEKVDKRDWDIDYIGFAYQTKGFPYHADAVWPENETDRQLGEPSHDHDGYTHYKGDWVDNYAHQRLFTTVLYLNNVSGGETHFPDHNITVQPNKKRIVGFHCDEKHVHGVMPVTSGIRKALILWFK